MTQIKSFLRENLFFVLMILLLAAMVIAGLAGLDDQLVGDINRGLSETSRSYGI